MSELLRRDSLLEGADSVELCLESAFFRLASPLVVFFLKCYCCTVRGEEILYVCECWAQNHAVGAEILSQGKLILDNNRPEKTEN